MMAKMTQYKWVCIVFCIFALLFLSSCEQRKWRHLPPGDRLNMEFRALLRKPMTQMINKPGEGHEWIEQIPVDTIGGKLDYMVSIFMGEYKDAFLISDEEAEKILQGKYDNEKNKANITEDLSLLARIAANVPFVLKHYVDKHYQDSLTDFEQELTARLLSTHLKLLEQQLSTEEY